MSSTVAGREIEIEIEREILRRRRRRRRRKFFFNSFLNSALQ